MPNPLPSAVRFYIRSLAGRLFDSEDNFNKTPFTESDLNADELQAVRVAMRNAQQDGRNYISYEDYPVKGGSNFQDADSILGEVDLLFQDPARSAMFTLGMATFDDEGVVHDKYDFAASEDLDISASDVVDAGLNAVFVDNNRRAVFNLIGNMSGLRSGTGRPIRINTRTDQPSTIAERARNLDD